MQLLRILRIRPTRREIVVRRPITEGQLRKGVLLRSDLYPVLTDDPHAQQLRVERGEVTRTTLPTVTAPDPVRACEDDVADASLHSTNPFQMSNDALSWCRLLSA